MATYIIRRLLLVPVLLFGVTVLIFGMLQFLTPVERATLYVKDIPKNDNASNMAWINPSMFSIGAGW